MPQAFEKQSRFQLPPAIGIWDTVNQSPDHLVVDPEKILSTTSSQFPQIHSRDRVKSSMDSLTGIQRSNAECSRAFPLHAPSEVMHPMGIDAKQTMSDVKREEMDPREI